MDTTPKAFCFANEQKNNRFVDYNFNQNTCEKS